ncbi:MAG: poly(A) polymerase [Cycloclasticus sp. symbiont of Poecilosclerida sp. M]|nr:MAG: poly(A) polymerase [Cycloclasticus sp. symbiont of Poecilosclerida sp. M]
MPSNNSPKTPKTFRLDALGISAKKLDKQATFVTKQLVENGFQAYLVGGCVRDLLLGLQPKDFDVATDAKPEQISKIFRNCRLIGRRFRLAHIHFGRHIIEVATFRGPSEKLKGKYRVIKDGRLLRDNVYGTLEEDAWRRDFTVNALYLDTIKHTVIDYVDGIKDHQNRTIHLMGDPVTRYKEDPVRLLRAVRFLVKLDFKLSPETSAPIRELAPLLNDIPAARLYDEVLKLFLNKKASSVFSALREYDLFAALFPQTQHCIDNSSDNIAVELIEHAMLNTEKRLASNQHIAPYFLVSTLLWEPVRQLTKKLRPSFNSDTQAIHAAANEVIAQQINRIALPKRLTAPMREVWALQPRFHKRIGVRCIRFMDHPRFRAAYDFMLLRSKHGEISPNIADWWTKIQTLTPAEQKAMTQPKKEQKKGRHQANKSDNKIVSN